MLSGRLRRLHEIVIQLKRESIMKRIVLTLLTLAMVCAVSTARAQLVFCKVVGQHQGTIRGDNIIKGLEDWIPVLSLASGVDRPFDQATGQATGKRQHQPLTIVKTLDKASPLLFLAAITNENLTVDCNIYRTAATGENQLFFHIKLTDSRIVEDDISGNGQINQGMRETVRFTFQKILLEDIPGKTSAEDDWQPAI
jgi:type VI secretion system secreted protein Hcp